MRGNFARTVLFTTLATLSFFAAHPSRADLITADAAYEKGDFKTAFQQFKDLAQLGQAIAQFNLAVMYARGQGDFEGAMRAEAHATGLAARLGWDLGPLQQRASAYASGKVWTGNVLSF